MTTPTNNDGKDDCFGNREEMIARFRSLSAIVDANLNQISADKKLVEMLEKQVTELREAIKTLYVYCDDEQESDLEHFGQVRELVNKALKQKGE